MRPISEDGIAFLRSAQRLFMAELFTFTLSDGSIARFTDADISVTYSGNRYAADSLIVSGLRLKLETGVRVDEQDLKIAAHPKDSMAGEAFLAGIGDGLLDGAWLTRERGFWALPEDALSSEPVVAIRMFYGRVSTITKAGRTSVELKVKSPLSLLDLELPRNYWGPTCLWTLYDAGCTLSKAAFSSDVVIGANPQPGSLPIAGGVPNAAELDGFPAYAFGRMLFTSGPNRNLLISLKDNDVIAVKPSVPLHVLPAPGDTAVLSLGCSKQLNSCVAKFNNKTNFRGFPFVPPVSFSL